MSKVDLPICRWERALELMSREGCRSEVRVGMAFLASLLASRIGVMTVAGTRRQRGHPLNTGSSWFER
jgi:hypothetical protein